MGSRDRKRAERKRRKGRAASREAQDPGFSATGGGAADGADGVDLTALAADVEGESRSEQRDAAARAALDPLEEGERPGIVTAGAILSLLIGLSTLVAWIAGVEVDGERPNPFQALAPGILFTVMAAGMWRARYWAVLGFEAIMVFLMLGATLSLVGAATAWHAVGSVVVGTGAGIFFWRTVKALARIQMPGPSPRA